MEEKLKNDGIVFKIEDNEIVERENFGHFEVLITKTGALFKTYTGFHVWTARYALGVDGKAGDMTLFSWLEALVHKKKEIVGHENEPYDGNSDITKGDMLESLKIVTEANLTASMSVFANEERAIKAAQSHIDWLKGYMEKLDSEMRKRAEEVDEKKEFEIIESAKIAEESMNLLK